MSARPNPLSPGKRSIRSVVAVATGLVCAAALTVAPASAGIDLDRSDQIPKLKGIVGPGFTITIDQASVPAGRYKLVVKDKATIHNFHISGTGVDKKTSVPGTGETIWAVDLVPGTYKIRCDPHSDDMKTKLTVT